MATVSLSKLDLSGIVWNHAPVVTRPKAVRTTKRSHLAMPRVVRDIVEYRSMQTGETITSRSQHREHLRRHDLVEVGNEDVQKINKRTRRENARKRMGSIRDDVQQAVKMYRDGYRNASGGPTAQDLGIDAPKVGAARVTAANQ